MNDDTIEQSPEDLVDFQNILRAKRILITPSDSKPKRAKARRAKE